MTRESKCGVCNHQVPNDHEQIQRKEVDGTTTPYHMRCEFTAGKLKSCEDCGQHRLLCEDCAEPIWESGGQGDE